MQQRVQRTGVGRDQRDAVLADLACDAFHRPRDAGAQVGERFSAARRVRARRRRARLIQLRVRGHDLRPRQTFPVAEAHLAPVGIEAKRECAGRQHDACGLGRAREVACDGRVDSLAGQQRGEGRRLCAALVVERDVRMSLKALVGVPGRAPMANAEKFHAARNGRERVDYPPCTASRSTMSLACSSSTERISSSIVRVVGSFSPKYVTSSR